MKELVEKVAELYAAFEKDASKRKRRFNAVKDCRSAVFFILCIMAVLYK